LRSLAVLTVKTPLPGGHKHWLILFLNVDHEVVMYIFFLFKGIEIHKMNANYLN
jgi:hypothetical protein